MDGARLEPTHHVAWCAEFSLDETKRQEVFPLKQTESWRSLASLTAHSLFGVRPVSEPKGWAEKHRLMVCLDWPWCKGVPPGLGEGGETRQQGCVVQGGWEGVIAVFIGV